MNSQNNPFSLTHLAAALGAARGAHMILGYHMILTAYGFWLPNDPRGSWSDFVGAWELFLAGGKATKVETRHSVAAAPHDRAHRLAMKQLLKHPPVTWDGHQAVAIAHGFQEVMTHWDLRIHACAILPQHVHLVIGRTHRPITQVMNQLKGRASGALSAAQIHPFQNSFDPDGGRATCWARRGWNVFLDSPEDMHRAIKYVENNPLKEGKKRQDWMFINPY